MKSDEDKLNVLLKTYNGKVDGFVGKKKGVNFKDERQLIHAPPFAKVKQKKPKLEQRNKTLFYVKAPKKPLTKKLEQSLFIKQEYVQPPMTAENAKDGVDAADKGLPSTLTKELALLGILCQLVHMVELALKSLFHHLVIKRL